MILYLDSSRLQERGAAHDYLQKALYLPDYYGKNLDALFDCLTEPESRTVFLTACPEPSGFFESLLRVFHAVEEENPLFSVAFLPEEKE